MISLPDEDGNYLLSFAVGSTSERMFEAALTAVSDKGDEEEVRVRRVGKSALFVVPY